MLARVSRLIKRGKSKTYPENQLSIFPVPAVTDVVGEETPCVAVVLILHQNPHPACLVGLIKHVLLPEHREKKRTGRVHDRDVRKQPAAVVRLQQLNDAKEERMLGDRAHRIIGDARWNSPTHPRGIREQRIQATIATL